MSIQIENNWKSTVNKEVFEQRAHFVPCSIEEDGPANVRKYFETYIKTNGDDLKASFRGHPLNGTNIKLPDGYRAVVATETKRPLSEDADRKFKVIGGFKELTYWNYDKPPSANDPLARALQWTDVAEAVRRRAQCT